MEIDFSAPEFSNIISLSKKRIEYHGCKHIHMTISEGEAGIKCNECGETLDPIWVLMRYATEEMNLRRRLITEAKRFNHISKWINFHSQSMH